MTTDHVLDLLPAYAIECLDYEDRGIVDAHLQDCECCRNGLDAYSRVLEDLPLRIALIEPPPDIRLRLLEQARHLSQDSLRSDHKLSKSNILRSAYPV